MNSSILNLTRFSTLMGLLLPAVQSSRESSGRSGAPRLSPSYQDSSILSAAEKTNLQRLADALARDPLLVIKFLIDPVRILSFYGILVGSGERSLFQQFAGTLR
jgi:hypothetical protein